MKINNWLKAIGDIRTARFVKNALGGRPRRRRTQRGVATTETLQARALLSINSVLNPTTGVLEVTADGDRNIEIARD